MTDKYAPCKRGCCWTPQGVCARQRECRCHQLLTLQDLIDAGHGTH